MPPSVYGSNPQLWFGSTFDSTYAVAQGVMDLYKDSLNLWHSQARAFADNGRFVPGTAAFDSIKNVITSTPFNRGGTMFFDQSKMVHAQGEYKWDVKKKGQEKNWFDLTTGASFRMYLPYSLGALFVDTMSYVYQRDSAG
jgi:hypothetical protein